MDKTIHFSKDILEDTIVLSDQTKIEIEVSRKQVKEGKTVSLEEIKKKHGIGQRKNVFK